jgi:hypothetical protein
MNNITVIVNKLNGNQLEICNSCAERHFGFILSSKIEYSLRRIKANIKLGMNKDALEYLLQHRVIDYNEFENYDAAKGSRTNIPVIEYRKKINIKLINFTDYNNKAAFEMIDDIFVWSQGQPEFDRNSVVKLRINMLNTGQVDTKSLDNFIESKGIKDFTIMKKRKLFGNSLMNIRPLIGQVVGYMKSILANFIL